MGQAERRHIPRAARHLIVRYRLAGDGKQGWLASPLLDLSCDGARFYSEAVFPIGAVLELHILLPGASKPVPLQAQVAWRKPGRLGTVELGVTFLYGEPALRQAVSAVVEHFLSKKEER